MKIESLTISLLKEHSRCHEFGEIQSRFELVPYFKQKKIKA
jgi:hypothetical protein